MMTEEAVQRLLVAELKGPACRCGAPKRPGQTFCRKCYYALEPIKQKNLYKLIGQGYENAYKAAVLALLDLGRLELERLPEWIDS